VPNEAYIGVLLAELRFPDCLSLKGKRKPLSSLRDVMQTRFRVSFSEVAFQESWQRAGVLVTLAASSGRQARERLDEVERYLHGREWEVGRVLISAAEPVEALWDVAFSK
jgi:uncharacterized protein YlxP (DUF503 family)